MALLEGKRALILGLASNRSIAWGIARAMRREGADLAFTCQNRRLGERVAKLAAEAGSDIVLECDVARDSEISRTFEALRERWDGLDVVVHAIAFAPREALQGDYLDSLTRDAHATAHDVSAYSFAALAKEARPMMHGRNGALLTLTYLGAARVIANYNVMGAAKASLEANVRYVAAALGPAGIRANAISAGPIKTLAAAGIADFRKILRQVETTSALRRNVTLDDIGNTAAFLCSDMAAGITGEIIHVDAGFSLMGMATP